MRRLLALAMLSIGCQSEPLAIRSESLPRDTGVDAGEDVAADVDAGPDAEPLEAAPPPSRTATRARFTTISLTLADHGIDGTFELWRDKRIDDAFVGKEWFGAFEYSPTGDFVTTPAVTAQLVLRNAHGKIVESLDLEHPLAKLDPVRLGDDVVPYLEVAIDTYAGAGRWGGTTHRFARVEAGRTQWLDCATAYQCALSCRFHYASRPSGGNDLLVWRNDYAGPTFTDAVTHFHRVRVEAGTCHTSTNVLKGWRGQMGEPPIMIPGDFPPP